MQDTLLGKKIEYRDQYDRSLLHSVPRKNARAELGISNPLPFNGADIWNCYEVSWLQYNGKPEVRILEITVPIDSENIIESKSLKIYLNSFNNTKFLNDAQVINVIQNDLSIAVKSQVIVQCHFLNIYNNFVLNEFAGVNLDLLDTEITNYNINKNLLSLSQEQAIVDETLYSNLLKSNCLVTGQPDWASIQISYTGQKIDHVGLLKYLISFRNHQEFHEQCVERIFIDIKNICKPTILTIYARYTRRGGIDINPIRSTHNINTTQIKNLRQIRQ